MSRPPSARLQGEQRASQRMVPGQLLHSALLELPLEELETRLDLEVARNPALERIEGPLCPTCGRVCRRGGCPDCGASAFRLAEQERWAERVWAGGAGRPEESDDPPWAERLPSGIEPIERIRLDARLICPRDEIPLLESILDHLSRDGYLRVDLYEIVSPLHRTVPDGERVLARIQSLDPAGVGARTLRECLRLQAARRDGPAAALLLRILDEGWDLLCDRRLEALAARLAVDLDGLRSALHLLRTRFTPSPLAALPDPPSPWGAATTVRPDLRFRLERGRPVAEVLDAASDRIRLDPEYQRLDRRHRRDGSADRSAEAVHVRHAMGAARAVLDGLARRRGTLLAIGEALAEAQAAFLLRGPLHLRPLTRRDLASRLSLHESTISRAVQGKWAELPGGETIALERFFHAADSPKALLRKLVESEDPGAPLTDSALVLALASAGHVVARRTVAKYRESLGIPPVDLRRET